MFYYIDEYHRKNKSVAKNIAKIVYDIEFQLLQAELEDLYKKLNFDSPGTKAFEDALYSFLVQEESFSTIKAY